MFLIKKKYFNPLVSIPLIMIGFILLVPTSTKLGRAFTVFGIHPIVFLGFLSIPFLGFYFFSKAYKPVEFCCCLYLGFISFYGLAAGNSPKELALGVLALSIFLVGFLGGKRFFSLSNVGRDIAILKLVVISVITQYLIVYFFYIEYLTDYDEVHLGRDWSSNSRIGFFSMNILLLFLTYAVSQYDQLYRSFFHFFGFALLGLAVYMSGFRTLLIACAVAAAFSLFRSRIKSVIFVLFLVFVAVVFGADLEGRYSVDTWVQSFLARNSPLIIEVSRFGLEEWVFGKGLGATIEIPWFEATALQNENRYMDGLYQTVFIKLGLSGLLGFLLLHFAVFFVPTPKVKERILLLVILIIIGSTNSYLWQLSCILYAFFWGGCFAKTKDLR